MLKNEKGITLLVLVVTIIIMLILISAGIAYGTNSAAEVELQNFSYELQQIQGRVDIIHERMSSEGKNKYYELDGVALGQDITSSREAVEALKSANGTNYDTTHNAELYPHGDTHTAYRYFSKSNLSSQLDIKNPKFDAIINFKTREVFSVQPHKYNKISIYSLKDIKEKV